jgi:hypothetical protein
VAYIILIYLEFPFIFVIRHDLKDLRMSVNIADNHIKSSARALIDYNYSLEKDSLVSSLNEKFLEQKISELEEIDSIREELYWLTFARLNELALFCAGNYADNFEFTSAGDLLVNPKLIAVHVRGLSEPVVKNRHSGITEQFGCAASTKKEVINWLKNETLVEIKKEPLLPYLYKILKKSGYLSKAYLSSIDTRMKKIADVIGHLCSWHLPNKHDLHQRLQQATQSEREFIKSRLCQFDTRTFYDLGFDFHKIIEGEGYKSKFLR